MSVRILVLLGLFQVGCSAQGRMAGDAGEPNVVDGTVGGTAFHPASAYAIGVDGRNPTVALAERANACADYQAGTARAQSRQLVLSFLVPAGGTLAAGEYTVKPPGGDPPLVVVGINGLDAMCKGQPTLATSGHVTLTASGDPLAGTFSATFAGGEMVTGRFRAAVCGGSPDGGLSCH
jgi:hypothetical protein